MSGAGSGPAARTTAEVAVVGGGLIGLATALDVADRGLSVAIVADERPGAASRAGAGLLVPHFSGEGARESVGRFMRASRDMYPSYVAAVEQRSGVSIPLSSAGALEIARSGDDCERLWADAPPDAERLRAAEVAGLEPALAPCSGGVLYPRDGAVDNVSLTNALASILSRHPRARIVRAPATRLSVDTEPAMVTTSDGTRIRSDRIVLAAGAWAAAIEGLPRHLPVRPLRGQICAVRGLPLRHVVLAPDAYLVGRGRDRTLVGSTMEDVGFDAATTPSGLKTLRAAAGVACPALDGAPLIEAWSGLRPATPDLLPILGADPDRPSLIYACGHSRNGILLAPLTAAVLGAILAGEAPGWDLSPFGIGRFDEDARGSNRPDLP
jgi:glycine oxidase